MIRKTVVAGVCGLMLALPAAASASVQPVGAPGNWRLTFDDEFSGTALNQTNWPALDYKPIINNVTPSPRNVTVSGGNAILTLSSSRSGAALDSDPATQGWGSGSGFDLPVGGFAEARIYFPGSGRTIYNWPAWWSSGPNWPAAGEEDIAEGLGTLTTNYHSPSGAHNFGTVPGTWSNAFHVYGLYRGAGYCQIFYDGKLVKQYSTDDNGQPQSLIINVGSGNTTRYGAASQVKVDYVRAWR
jgi:hypothetical protein